MLLEENDCLKRQVILRRQYRVFKDLDGLLMHFMLIYIVNYNFLNILLHKINMCMMLFDF